MPSLSRLLLNGRAPRSLGLRRVIVQANINTLGLPRTQSRELLLPLRRHGLESRGDSCGHLQRRRRHPRHWTRIRLTQQTDGVFFLAQVAHFTDWIVRERLEERALHSGDRGGVAPSPTARGHRARPAARRPSRSCFLPEMWVTHDATLDNEGRVRGPTFLPYLIKRSTTLY